MGDEWRTYEIKFKPFPNERFAADANVTLPRELKSHRGSVIGTITGHEIVNGELVVTARIEAQELHGKL